MSQEHGIVCDAVGENWYKFLIGGLLLDTPKILVQTLDSMWGPWDCLPTTQPGSSSITERWEKNTRYWPVERHIKKQVEKQLKFAANSDVECLASMHDG